jgi:prepilin-type N-terminal cleavage/methylation domain-containing protein
MKKVLRGFTLIELVVVMAILTLIMGGLMQFFGPVRDAYLDATYYESKRNACNAISRYITESLRYSQYLGAYIPTDSITGGGTIGTDETGAKNAAQELLNRIKNDVTITDDTAIKESIQVIMIDYNDTTWSGNTYNGRVYRYKNLLAGTLHDHMALGEAYYGRNSFGITVKYDDLLTVETSTANADGSSIVTTPAAVNIQNLNGIGKLYGGTDAKKWKSDHSALEAGTDGIPDILQDDGTIATTSKQYFFAFLPAKDALEI